MIGIYSLCQAKPWQDYGTCCNEGATTWPSDDDVLMLNDISDTTDDADGTLMQVPWIKVQPRDADLTSIAALSTSSYGRALLESAQPDDGELVIGDTGNGTPIWGNITETGDSLTVSNGAGTINLVPHANLEAIADAEAGVADPAITMYDTSAGAGTADIFGTSTGAYDIIMSLWVDVAGTPTEYLQIDGVSETVDVLKPLDAGTKWASVTQTDLDLSSATNCSGQYYFLASSTGDGELILPDEPRCQGIANNSKIYHLQSYDDGAPAAYDLDVTPQTGDTIYLDGTACAASAALELDDVGDWAILSGYSTTYWLVIAHSGATCTRP